MLCYEYRVSQQKGENLNFDPIKRGNFEFLPSYIIKITNFPLLIGSFCKRSSLRSQTFSFQEDSRHNCMPKKVWKLSACSLTLLMTRLEGHFSACMSGKLRTFGLDARSLITCRARIFPRKKNLGTWDGESNNKKAMYHLAFFSLCTHPFKFSYIKEMKNCTWKNLLGFYWGPERK